LGFPAGGGACLPPTSYLSQASITGNISISNDLFFNLKKSQPKVLKICAKRAREVNRHFQP
jgi:hypothetical protein